MTIQFKTYFSTLLKLAREQYLAEQSGDAVQIEKATKAHNEYKELCLKHEMVIGLLGDL